MASVYLLCLLLLVHHSTSDPISKLCDGSNYTENDNFGSNLNALLSSLSKSSINSTFANITKGFAPDQAYGSFLCRGDISLPDCNSCIQTAIQDARQVCPSKKQVTTWYDTCQLRYSDRSFFSSFGNDVVIHYWGGGNATDTATFSKNEGVLMSNLSQQAAYNSSILFATGEMLHGTNDQQSLYGLVQCTRDLSAEMCYKCLNEIINQCCGGQIEGGVLGRSCNFRYDEVKFFKGEPDVSITTHVSSSAPAPAPAPAPALLPSFLQA